MDKQYIQLKDYIDKASKILGFTGAGISTGAGIPDYRSQGGIWQKYTPVYYHEFISNEEKRIEYWQGKIELWPQVRQAKPTSGHYFFTNLEKTGKMIGLITQNIDGLHKASGFPEEKLISMHGNNQEIACLSCSYRIDGTEIMDSIDLSQGAPLCPECGGYLKPNTISFGQNLRTKDINRSFKMAKECDMIIAMGSTLIVNPAARLPKIALENGAVLVIVTLSETPYDSQAELLFHEDIGEFVKQCSKQNVP